MSLRRATKTLLKEYSKSKRIGTDKIRFIWMTNQKFGEILSGRIIPMKFMNKLGEFWLHRDGTLRVFGNSESKY